MATLEELSNALVNADKAGDVEAAKAIANVIQSMRAAQTVASTSPSPIAEGDWKGLGSRLDAVQKTLQDAGPVRPEAIASARQEAARREGRLYGATRSPGETAFRRATDTFALGLPNLLEAATSGFGTGLSTAENHEFIKAADEGRGRANPISGVAGDIAGGIGQALALPMGSATAAGRILTGTGQAAALGAGQGAIESRGGIGETVKGGAMGSIAGLAGGAVGEGLVAGGRALIDPMRGLMRSGPANEQAAARVLYAADKAGVTPQSVRQTVSDLGADAFLADTLGRHGEALARSTANTSPEARGILEAASKQRLGGQTDRVIEALQHAGGLPQRMTVQELSDAAAARARPQINSAYEQARAAGYDLPNTPFKWTDDSPMVQSALRQAEAQTADRTAAFGNDQASKFSVWDATRQILARQGFEEGDPVAKALARRLNQTVDDALPEASGARSLAQDLKQRQAALELGAEGARMNPGGDFPNRLAALGLPPRPELGQGFAAQAIENISNRKPGVSALDQLTGTKSARETLTAVLMGRADDVNRRIAAERQFMNFDRALSGNSTTARQLMELGGLGAAGAAGGYLAGFDPTASGVAAAAAGLGRRGLVKLVASMNSRNEQQVAPILADILTRQALPALSKKETARRLIMEEMLKLGSRGAGLTAATGSSW